MSSAFFIQILIISMEMANSEKYVLKDKFKTASGIRKLQTDKSTAVREMENCGVNVDQILGGATVTHMKSSLSKKQMRKLVTVFLKCFVLRTVFFQRRRNKVNFGSISLLIIGVYVLLIVLINLF